MNSMFDLPLGFIYIQIGLGGIILAILGCIASLVVWLSRRAFLKALPSAYVVLAMPPMLLGIVPGVENVAVPLAFMAACLTCLLHLRHARSETGTRTDTFVAAALLFGLSAIVISYALGSLSGGE